MNKIESPPCIKNKCILYPVCRNKKIINCNTLCDMISKYEDGGTRYIKSKRKVIKILPNTETIKGWSNIHKGYRSYYLQIFPRNKG